MGTNNIDWILHIASSSEQIFKMVVGFAYIMGCVLVFKSLFLLKKYGEMRTSQTSGGEGIKESIFYLMVGVILIYLPTGFNIIMNTTFGESSVLSYSNLPTEFSFSNMEVSATVLHILQMFGVISFVRGWILIARAQNQGGQPASLYKGLFQIFAGVMLMNVVGAIQIWYNTIGQYKSEFIGQTTIDNKPKLDTRNLRPEYLRYY